MLYRAKCLIDSSELLVLGPTDDVPPDRSPLVLAVEGNKEQHIQSVAMGRVEALALARSILAHYHEPW